MGLLDTMYKLSVSPILTIYTKEEKHPSMVVFKSHSKGVMRIHCFRGDDEWTYYLLPSAAQIGIYEGNEPLSILVETDEEDPLELRDM